jgi:hypothetical protein
MFPEFKPLTAVIAFLAMAFLCDMGSAAASTPDKPKNALFLVRLSDLETVLTPVTKRFSGN